MYTRKKNIFVRMSENVNVQKALGVILPVLLGIVIFVLWQTQVIHKIFHVDVFTLPLPTRIVSIMIDNISDILINTKATVFAAAIGLLIGSVIGYVIAWVADRWKGFSHIQRTRRIFYRRPSHGRWCRARRHLRRHD